MFSKVRPWLMAAMLTMTVIAIPLSAGFGQEGSDPKTPTDMSEPTEEEKQPKELPVEISEATGIDYAPRFVVDNLWIMIAGMLVFIMHLGFATLESGLTRAKNTVNILFKNSMIICIGLLTYGIMGFNLMYPGYDTDDKVHSETEEPTTEFEDGGVFGFAGFDFLAKGTVETDDPALMTADYGLDMTTYTDFFFQAMFAATCCTIVSGAVAGRIKLSSFLIFATLFVMLSYPITGSWQWGQGWLLRLGFHDFAGSTLVHSVGGWGALVMAILLGPRKGKYVDGQVKAIPASSLPLAAVGVFLLWFGWFGFNGGSVLNATPGMVSLVLVTTSMAAAAGGFAAAITSWIHSKKPDLSMALNGILAGLVGITAGADQMTGADAVIIGLISGILVYVAVIFIDTKLKIDDPVGAISVHLVCGIWGTLCVGIFGAKGFISKFGEEGAFDQIINQVIGIGAIGAFTVAFCLVVGIALKATMGIRVSPEEEEKGLDIGEHGMEAYSM